MKVMQKHARGMQCRRRRMVALAADSPAGHMGTWELHVASAQGGRCMARSHMREAPSPHPPPGGLLLR